MLLHFLELENVSYYKYLGVTMSTRLSWSPAQTTLAVQAKKAQLAINKVNNQCDYSFKTACDIFDKCILPILTYGSEVWGVEVHKAIESVHSKFCKIQLGVGKNTPNPAVLGECGRDRMYINCIIKCIKYWIKLISLPPETLLGSCYLFLYNQCLLGKSNWVSKIRDILFKYGFGWVWEDQSVTNVVLFITMFTERVKDCEMQLWATDLHDMPKLRLYSLFKESREEEFYLSLAIPKRLRFALARFRTGSHSLEIEVGRHKNINIEDRLCKFCGLSDNAIVIEDEYHVLFHCSAYNDIRNMYIGREITSVPNIHSFVTMMKNNNTQDTINFAHFIYSLFKIRKKFICEL